MKRKKLKNFLLIAVINCSHRRSHGLFLKSKWRFFFKLESRLPPDTMQQTVGS